MPSAEVSEPESWGERGSYMSGDGGGGEAGRGRETGTCGGLGG